MNNASRIDSSGGVSVGTEWSPRPIQGAVPDKFRNMSHIGPILGNIVAQMRSKRGSILWKKPLKGQLGKVQSRIRPDDMMPMGMDMNHDRKILLSALNPPTTRTS
eukprot:726393_1